MEYSRELGKQMKTFEQHWEETLSKQKTTHSQSAVALLLEKFQDADSLPRTGGPLPHRLRKALRKQPYRSVSALGAVYAVSLSLQVSCSIDLQHAGGQHANL